MFMIYLHIKFHMPNPSDTLIIDIKPKLNSDFIRPPYSCLKSV